jgi:hypothetical protein
MSAINTTVEFRNVLSMIRSDLNILYELIYARQSMSDFVLGNVTHKYIDRTRPALIRFKEVTDTMKSEGVSVQVAFSEILSSIYEFSWIIAQGNIPSFSMSLVDEQCQSLLNLSSDFYVSVRKNINGKIFSNIQSNREKSLAMFCVELSFGVICAIVFKILITKINETIFKMIQTTQPSIMTMIAHLFDGVCSSSTNCRRQSRLRSLTIPVLLLFLSLSVHPIVLFSIQSSIDVRGPVPDLPSLGILTWEQDMMIYSIAELECVLVQQGVLRICESGCYHSLATIDYSDYVISSNPLSTYLGLLKDMVHSMLLPLQFVIIFVWCCFGIEEMFRAGISIVQSYPTRFIGSHPLFSELMSTNTITLDEIRSFTEEIERDPNPPEFLCFVEFDEVGRVVQWIGKADELLNFEVHTIMDFVFQLCPVHPEVISFFESKMDGVSLSISNSEGHAICLTFGEHGRILTIKDDAHNVDNHRKRGLMERLSKNISEFESLPEGCFDQVIVVGLCVGEDFGLNLKLPSGCVKVDSRDDILICVFEQNPEGGRKALDFVQSLRSQSGSVRCVVHAGGPLIFFDSRGPVSKPRCFGRVYDEVKQMMRIIWVGKMLVTRSFLIETGRDISNVYFSDVYATERPISVTFL